MKINKRSTIHSFGFLCNRVDYSVFLQKTITDPRRVLMEKEIYFFLESLESTLNNSRRLSTHIYADIVFLTKRNQTLNNSWIAYNKIILSLHKSLYINWFPTCTLNNRLFALIFHIKDFTLFDMQRCGNWFFFPEIFFTLTMEPCALTRRYFDRKRHSWVSNVL